MAIASRILNPNEIRDRKRASIISVLTSSLLLLAKFWAHNKTGSQAIFSDAMESIVNVMAAGLALFVVHYASKPKDQDHPYGHGKIEYFSSAFEGGLITFAAVFIMIEAVHAMWTGNQVRDLDVGVFVVFSAGLVNLLLGWFLIRSGTTRGSIALRASGQHVISDFWTSLGIGIGLWIVHLTGILWVDSFLALLVGVWLAISGIKLVRESIGGLMDKEDIPVLESLADVLRRHVVPGIIQIHNARVIRSGWYHHIDAHVVLPEFWSVRELHEKMNLFEKKVIDSYPFGGEMNFHFDPCRRAYCEVCDLQDCKIRVQEFKKRIPVKLEHLRSPDEPVEFSKRLKKKSDQ